MTFVVTPLLADGEFKVSGTDGAGTYGECKLVSQDWQLVLDMRRHEEAAKVFDEGVREMTKPLRKAIKKAKKIAHPSTNPWSKVVISKGTEFEPAVEIYLDTNGQILRMIEETGGTNLSWLNGELVASR